MWNGKQKAVTFSYDDGITQDKRLIKLFDKYGLRCTFNINSGFLGTAGSLVRQEVTVAHCKPRACEIADIYRGHEVASHTLTHPFLTNLPDDEVIRQVEDDRRALSDIVGYDVVGMAYPCGGANHDDRVAKLIRENTGIKYARTIISTHDFAPQDDLLKFRPTVWHGEWDELFRLADDFLNCDASSPALFYIWGHAYEFDIRDEWELFEKFCARISGRDDVFYGTNREIFGL